jgi:hypothetical protein
MLYHNPEIKGLKPTMEQHALKKSKQLLEYQNLFLLRDIWGQCYKTFYRGNLLPFHGNTGILFYKATLPW